jgi:hypothetical protein
MLRPGHIRLPKDEAAEAERAAAYDRKQKWKELSGNRYTPEELRQMSEELGQFTILTPEPVVMHID